MPPREWTRWNRAQIWGWGEGRGGGGSVGSKFFAAEENEVYNCGGGGRSSCSRTRRRPLMTALTAAVKVLKVLQEDRNAGGNEKKVNAPKYTVHRCHRPKQMFTNVNTFPCPACGLQPSLQQSHFNPEVPSARGRDSHGWGGGKKKHQQRKVRFHLESSQASTH